MDFAKNTMHVLLELPMNVFQQCDILKVLQQVCRFIDCCDLRVQIKIFGFGPDSIHMML